MQLIKFLSALLRNVNGKNAFDPVRIGVLGWKLVRRFCCSILLTIFESIQRGGRGRFISIQTIHIEIIIGYFFKTAYRFWFQTVAGEQNSVETMQYNRNIALALLIERYSLVYCTLNCCLSSSQYLNISSNDFYFSYIHIQPITFVIIHLNCCFCCSLNCCCYCSCSNSKPNRIIIDSMKDNKGFSMRRFTKSRR